MFGRSLGVGMLAAVAGLAVVAPALAQVQIPEWKDSVDAEGAMATRRTEWVEPCPMPVQRAYSSRLTVQPIDINSPPEGDIPRELAFSPDGNTVVIANQGTGLVNGTMTFFDVNTRTITHTVEVGLFPSHVAVSPNGQFAVCANVLSHTVSVVHLPTRTLLGHVPITGTQPFKVAITPDSQFAVVSVTNDAVNSSFSVVDLNTRTEVRNFPSHSQGTIGGFFTPEVGISGALFSKWAMSPDGTTIVLPDAVGGRVFFYDVATGAQIDVLSTAALPRSVDISADGTTAIVGHEGNTRKIAKINMATRAFTLVDVPDQIQDQMIRITPDKNFAMAPITNNLAFYDLATGARTGQVSTGIVGDIEISFDGQYAFVSNFNSSVINIATQSLARTLTLAACTEAAISPTQLRAVALNNRFREDIHVYNINGAAGFVEGQALTGAPPEGDCSRSVGASADGSVVVVGNTTSRNVAIINGATGAVQGYVDTGDRILDLAVTPNGQYAVVCNTDASTVSIVNTATRTIAANLSVPTRPAKVKLSADGTKAYVLSVAGTDMIHFINVAGAASVVTGTAIAGQTGTAQGYAYTDNSGIELSPDGSLLAVCVSFDDQVKLIDTATRAIVATVPVGISPTVMEFPMRAAFSPDGTKLYVTMAFGDAVAVVNVAGAASSLVTTMPCGDFPLTVNVDSAGQYVYVGTSGTGPGIFVYDAATNGALLQLPLGGTVRAAALDGSTLYVAGLNNNTGGKLWRVNAAGAGSSINDETTLSGSPSDMAFNPVARKAFMAQPVPDWVDVVAVALPCGNSDFNGDGDFGTDADIEAFFACLAGNCCPTCYPGGSDFNADGDFGTDADIESFFRVLAGGPC